MCLDLIVFLDFFIFFCLCLICMGRVVLNKLTLLMWYNFLNEVIVNS